MSETPESAVRALYESNLKREYALSVLSGDAETSQREVDALRSRIRADYEQILLTAPAFAADNKVELNMWKSCFYQPIKVFRQRISAAQKGGSPSLPQMRASFEAFLKEAAQFYMTLLKRLDEVRREEDPCARTHTVRSVVQCLIYGGDLSRYSVAALAAPSPRDWERARVCYHIAIKVAPWQGTPHNQLGVVATRSGDDVEALYRYTRALLAEEPFQGATDNLPAAYDKNRAAFKELSAADSPHGPASVRCVRLHGLVHDAICGDGDALRSVPPLLRSVRSDLSSALRASALPDAQLLKLSCIAIYNVHLSRRARDHRHRLAAAAALLSVASAAFEGVLAAGEGAAPARRVYALGRAALGPLVAVLSYLALPGGGDVLGSWDEIAEDAEAEGLRAAALELRGACADAHAALRRLAVPLGAQCHSFEGEGCFMPEELELRGFVPLAPSLRHLFASTPIGQMGLRLREMDEESCCQRRVHHLLALPKTIFPAADAAADDDDADAMDDDDDDDGEELIVFSPGAKGPPQPEPEAPPPARAPPAELPPPQPQPELPPEPLPQPQPQPQPQPPAESPAQRLPFASGADAAQMAWLGSNPFGLAEEAAPQNGGDAHGPPPGFEL